MKKGEMLLRNFRIDRRDMAYLKYILEGYEGLATVTTIQRGEPAVRLSVAPDFSADVDGILEALRGEIDMCEIGGGDAK
jgi:hypothetical protein